MWGFQLFSELKRTTNYKTRIFKPQQRHKNRERVIRPSCHLCPLSGRLLVVLQELGVVDGSSSPPFTEGCPLGLFSFFTTILSQWGDSALGRNNPPSAHVYSVALKVKQKYEAIPKFSLPSHSLSDRVFNKRKSILLWTEFVFLYQPATWSIHYARGSNCLPKNNVFGLSHWGLKVINILSLYMCVSLYSHVYIYIHILYYKSGQMFPGG